METIFLIQPEIKLDLLDLQAKNRLGKDTLVIVPNDPVYHKLKRYRAVNAVSLIRTEIDLTKIDIQNTRIVFECLDGYQPEMPLDLFLKAKPYLAFQDVDAPENIGWEKIFKNGNEMNAAPFYLVYETVSERDAHSQWPYNLVKFHLELPGNSAKELLPGKNTKFETGYNLFIAHCITCHAINGIGGEMGPELNIPKSVTEYWLENELVDYLVNPASFRNKVKMPALGISKAQSQEIVDYLKFMSENKKTYRYKEPD